MAYDWQSLIPYGVQFGLGTLGNRMATGPIREQNEWQRQQYEQERQRRNLMQSFAAPSMLKALGHQPEQIPGMTQQVRGNPPLGSGSTGNGMVPQAQDSRAGKILGGASAGLGAAGVLGLSSMAGPLGLAAGLGSLAVSQIGKGRRTANMATGNEGFEGQFRGVLERAARGEASLQELQAARQAYEQAIQAWQSQGGNHAKVAGQSLQNQPLQQTYQTLLSQLGGR